jgi:hypothetical protein
MCSNRREEKEEEDVTVSRLEDHNRLFMVKRRFWRLN